MKKGEAMVTPEEKPNRMQKRTAVTRKKLIVAAIKNFTKKGVDGTNIQDITETADLALGTFYTHFETKDHLIETIVAHILEVHERNIEDIAKVIKDPAVISYIGTRAMIEQLYDDPTFQWLVRKPELLVDKIMTAIRPFADQVIANAIKSGRMEARVTPEIVLYFIFWGLVGLLNTVERGIITSTKTKMINEFERLYLRLFDINEEEFRELDRKYKKTARLIASNTNLDYI